MTFYSAVRRLFTENDPMIAADPSASQYGKTEYDLRVDAEAILQAAVGAADPETLVEDAMHSHKRSIPANGRVWVAGFGKAVVPMAQGLYRSLGDRIEGGILVAPVGTQAYIAPQFEIFRGGYPLPDQGGVAGACAIRQMASEAAEDDLFICLISGGGSALLSLPPDDLPIEDVQVVTDLLHRAGAGIAEINCVRRHLDLLKGGQLAREAAPARVLSLMLSNVVDNPPDIVASGPVSPDPTRFSDAVGVLKRYGLWKQVPLAARGWLDRGVCGEIDETPDKNDTMFLRTTHVVIGSADTAARAACAEADRLGYEAQVLTTTLAGEASEAGGFLAETARVLRASQAPGRPPTCIVTAGATSVRRNGNGNGGRNQELALGAALEIDRMDGVLIASMSTDGFDGATDAAGATATGSTVRRATDSGVDCAEARVRNDAYSVFDALDDLIVSGPTGTSVADIQIVLLS
jgi:hydroxypyruvate reductase